MRSRHRILNSLEKAYLDSYRHAESAGDEDRMIVLDRDYQRDQIFLEALLDLRDLFKGLSDARPADPGATEKAKSFLDQARSLKKLTRLR